MAGQRFDLTLSTGHTLTNVRVRFLATRWLGGGQQPVRYDSERAAWAQASLDMLRDAIARVEAGSIGLPHEPRPGCATVEAGPGLEASVPLAGMRAELARPRCTDCGAPFTGPGNGWCRHEWTSTVLA